MTLDELRDHKPNGYFSLKLYGDVAALKRDNGIDNLVCIEVRDLEYVGAMLTECGRQIREGKEKRARAKQQEEDDCG